MNVLIHYHKTPESDTDIIAKSNLVSQSNYKTRRISRTVVADCYDEGQIVARAAYDVLPHGSGINGDWHIKQSKSNPHVWRAYNDYSAMDEAGGYCHDHKFRVDFAAEWLKTDFGAIVTLIVLDVTVLKHGNSRCDCGYGLSEYLSDTIFGDGRESVTLHYDL